VTSLADHHVACCSVMEKELKIHYQLRSTENKPFRGLINWPPWPMVFWVSTEDIYF